MKKKKPFNAVSEIKEPPNLLNHSGVTHLNDAVTSKYDVRRNYPLTYDPNQQMNEN